MASFTEWLNKLSRKSEMPEHIKEPLKRSNRFIEDYTQWPKNELVDLNLYIQNLISEAEAEGTTWPWITYMNNPKSRGLIFHAHEELPEFNWQYLMESIKDSLMKVHTYILQHSLNERKLVAKDVHSKEVYYLKPRPSFDDSQKLIQQYGNIRLEYRHINDQFTEFRIQATYYQGFNYGEITPLEELFEWSSGE